MEEHKATPCRSLVALDLLSMVGLAVWGFFVKRTQPGPLCA